MIVDKTVFNKKVDEMKSSDFFILMAHIEFSGTVYISVKGPSILLIDDLFLVIFLRAYLLRKDRLFSTFGPYI